MAPAVFTTTVNILCHRADKFSESVILFDYRFNVTLPGIGYKAISSCLILLKGMDVRVKPKGGNLEAFTL